MRTHYDKNLSEIPHYQKFPEMLPFIGTEWKSSDRILLLGESHYIHGEDLIAHFGDNTILNDWYSFGSQDFNDDFRVNINTRRTVTKAQTTGPYDSSLSFLYNVMDALRTGTIKYKSLENPLEYFSFMNYFQKPSFVEGKSVQNNSTDDEFAFKNLKYVISIIRPQNIIFMSSKAYDSFLPWQEKEMISVNLIDKVQHPGSAWWNMMSVVNKGRTGREKFIEIINGISTK